MISLNSIEKKFRNKMVLSNVSFEIDSPGIYVINGKNGSGKSTLLKIISKIIYKSNGKINIDGTISYLPDKFIMPRLMRASAYLKLALDDNQNIKELMNKYLIPNKKIRELSKGNLQKLGLLQILNKNADIYVLDEPLDGLDDTAKKIIKQDIIDLVNSGKIIILSLHTKTTFGDLKSQVFEIKDGCINEKRKKS